MVMLTDRSTRVNVRSKDQGIPPSQNKSLDNKSFPDFLRLVAKRNTPVLKSSYGVEKAAMTEASGTTGGYLVPVGFNRQIMEVVSENSFVYPRATVVPMTSREVLVSRLDAETAQAANTPPYFGGMKFTWGSEQAPAEAEPKFKQTSLTAWDMLGYSVVSNQFLWDIGVEGEQYLYKMFGHAAAYFLEYAFFNGTGTAKQMPLGMLNAPCKKLVTRAGGGHIVQIDIANMVAGLLPFCWQHAIWACHPTVFADLTRVTGWVPNEYISESELHTGFAGCLIGRPLFVTDKLPPLGTSGELLLFDPRLYVIGMRQEVVVDFSDQASATLYQQNQSVFRVWLRADGKPWLDGVVTLTDGSNTASSIVALS